MINKTRRASRPQPRKPKPHPAKGETYLVTFTQSFDEWRVSLVARGIRPYENAAGEVDYFWIELTLNELGEAFLIVDKFATEGVRQLTN